MINNIKLQTGEKLLLIHKNGRNTIFTFDKNIIKTASELKNEKILIQCSGNKEWFKRPYRAIFKNKPWFSNKFYATDHNPFKGKHHSEENKIRHSKFMTGRYVGGSNACYKKIYSEDERKLRSERQKGKRTGKDNPFYGKKHSSILMRQIMENRKKTFANWSREKKEEYSRKMSDAQKRLIKENPTKYRRNKQHAATISASSSKKYHINKLETIVSNKLKEMNMLDFEYSIILDKKQFDFGCKNKRILIEVNGTYWHGDPRNYTNDQLNKIQKNKKNADLQKMQFAINHNMKLFIIWEKDILENNWTILKEIEKCYNLLN